MGKGFYAFGWHKKENNFGGKNFVWLIENSGKELKKVEIIILP